jgi:hypothetical protein
VVRREQIGMSNCNVKVPLTPKFFRDLRGLRAHTPITLNYSKFSQLFLDLTMLNLHRVSSSKILPLGSDFPIEGVNPLLGFYAAVSRLSVDGESPHGKGGW